MSDFRRILRLQARVEALEQGGGGGGTVGDSLALPDFLSVGDAPAQSGAVRLEEDGAVVARTGSTDLPFVSLASTAGLEAAGVSSTLATHLSPIWMLDASGYGVFTRYGFYIGNNASLIWAKADGSGVLQAIKVGNDDNLAIAIRAAFSGGAIFVDGSVKMQNLPTEDPVDAGVVWNDSGTLKVSAGV